LQLSSKGKLVVVHSTLTAEQREAMGKILDQVEGTPLARSGDIALEYGGKRYVFSDQSGGHVGASVARSGGTEIIRDDDG